jgi:hypothetical protein
MKIKKLIASTTVVLAASGTAGYFQSTHAGATSTFGNTFSVVEHFTGSGSEGSGPGATDVEKATLTHAGNVVGEARSACTGVLDTTVICNGVWTITGYGDLLLEGSFDTAQPLPGFDIAVTGGTGAFAGKDGWVHFDETRPSNGSTQTFHLGS